MLKLLIGLLLLANGGLFAYNAGYLGAGSDEGREPLRATRQLAPQSIKLIGSGAPAQSAPAQSAATRPATAAVVDPDAAAVAAGTAAASPAPAAVTTPSAATAPAVATAATAASCVEIGNFDAADARRFDQLLTPLALGDRVTRRAIQEKSERHMVFIPPLPDKESAERKAGELRRLGIQDFYVIQDNSDLRFGISLGMFKTEEAARQHLVDLTRQGVRTARVATRPGPAAKTAFQLRGLDTAAQSAVERIRRGFPALESRACAAA